jgi:hypothetical protein
MDPDTNDTGDFQLEYKKSDDETAQLKGSMKNNTMQTLEKTTSEDIKKILETLHNSTKFQNYNSLLQKNGYMPGEIQVEKEGNKTKVTVPYSDEKNGSADIKSVIENNKVKEVRLEGFAKRSYWWLFLLIGIPIMAYMIYSRYFRQKKVIENKSQLVENQIDPKKEALILLEEAKRLFEERKEKDAYGKAAQAIRLYCSYKADLNCEMTNSELVKNMKKKRIKHEDVQKCLNLCSLVEFAKYQANKKDFDEIIERAEKVIK